MHAGALDEPCRLTSLPLPLARPQREEKKRAKKGLQTVNWGAHGILTEADRYNKADEFHAWLIGEKTINPETLSKAKEKEIFMQFMEVRLGVSLLLSMLPTNRRDDNLQLADPSFAALPRHLLLRAQDYNTCTLPHDKYYDIGKWEKQMAAVRMGETVEKSDAYDWRKDEECASAVLSLTRLLAPQSLPAERVSPG